MNVEGSKPTVSFLDIEHIGDLDFHVDGLLGPLNWIVGKVSSFVGNIVKRFVGNLLQSPIRNLLTERLLNSTISLDKFGCNKRV